MYDGSQLRPVDLGGHKIDGAVWRDGDTIHVEHPTRGLFSGKVSEWVVSPDRDNGKIVAEESWDRFNFVLQCSSVFSVSLNYMVDDLETARMVCHLQEQNTNKDDTCPVCWGSGYMRGFGAPCERGCSEPPAVTGLRRI